MGICVTNDASCFYLSNDRTKWSRYPLDKQKPISKCLELFLGHLLKQNLYYENF